MLGHISLLYSYRESDPLHWLPKCYASVPTLSSTTDVSLSPENLPYSWLLCPSQVDCGPSTQAETPKSPSPLPHNERQVNKGQRKGWVRSHRMPCDPCWQESSWRRGLGPARVDGTNHPERMRGSGGCRHSMWRVLLKNYVQRWPSSWLLSCQWRTVSLF